MEKLTYKNAVVVDIDFNRKPQVEVMSVFRNEDMEYEQANKGNILGDIATLSEGIVTLIHSCHKAGIKKDYELLNDVIKHLTEGFADASYRTYELKIGEDGKLKEKQKGEQDG